MELILKLCECGCGKPAPVAKKNRPERNIKKGDTLRYISGHNITRRNTNHNDFIDERGYKRVYKPDHPRAYKSGYIREHILIAEAKLGRALVPGEVVHHINGILADNRIENIEVFANNGEHISHHHKIGSFNERYKLGRKK